MITSQDLLIIAFLVFLEGILSIDNALVLAMLARGLPKPLQKRALTYGLIGAIVFRLAALLVVRYLMKWTWVKFVGGAYLIFIALKHFLKSNGTTSNKTQTHSNVRSNFWRTVILIELTDIAFAVDSILAAIALSPKFWVVFTGGIIGVLLMRIAANQFICLLDRFPRFENTAYLLVLTIGIKILIEGFRFPEVEFHSPRSPWFWGFWGIIAACIIYGLLPSRKTPPKPTADPSA